jgi:hypothetical protein
MNTETNTEIAPHVEVATDGTSAAFTAQVRQARALAASDLVPQQYRNNVANVMVATELASRIGASVMAVMQNLHVIQGKPSFSSSFLIACVNSCGRFSPMRFRSIGEGDDYGVRAVATDLKTGEECEGPAVTWKMVKAEKWNAKNGSKWLTMPDVMFNYRAAAFWARLYAPELSLGMHTVDEHEDIAATVTVLRDAGPKPTRPRALESIAAPSAPSAPATQPEEPGDAQAPAGEAVAASQAGSI